MNNSSALSTTDNSTTAAKADLGITVWELWLQIVVFYLCMAAVGGTTLNTYVGVCIMRSKRLRSRFYVIICSWLLTRASLGFQYIFIASYRILRTLDMVPLNIPQIACHSIHFFVYYVSLTDMFLLLFLVVDRLIAIIKPNYYRLLTVRQAALISAAIIVVNVFVTQLPSYIGVSLTAVIPCLNVLSPLSPGFNQFREQVPIALIGLLLLLQLVTMGLTWKKLRELKRQSRETEQSVFVKRQAAMTAAMRNIVFSHAGLIVLVRLYLLFDSLFPAASSRLVAVAGITQSFDVFTGVIILLCSKKELRQECRLDCCGSRRDGQKSLLTVLGARSCSQNNAKSAASEIA